MNRILGMTTYPMFTSVIPNVYIIGYITVPNIYDYWVLQGTQYHVLFEPNIGYDIVPNIHNLLVPYIHGFVPNDCSLQPYN